MAKRVPNGTNVWPLDEMEEEEVLAAEETRAAREYLAAYGGMAC